MRRRRRCDSSRQLFPARAAVGQTAEATPLAYDCRAFFNRSGAPSRRRTRSGLMRPLQAMDALHEDADVMLFSEMSSSSLRFCSRTRAANCAFLGDGSLHLWQLPSSAALDSDSESSWCSDASASSWRPGTGAQQARALFDAAASGSSAQLGTGGRENPTAAQDRLIHAMKTSMPTRARPIIVLLSPPPEEAAERVQEPRRSRTRTPVDGLPRTGPDDLTDSDRKRASRGLWNDSSSTLLKWLA